MMAFYGVGNHGGGPTRENLDSIRRLDGAGSMPHLVHSTPRRFFDAVLASGASSRSWPRSSSTTRWAATTAHSGIKRWMRRAESALASAETWSTVARTLVAAAYPADDLRRAWKGVLFNQFHDTLGGTAIEPAYRDARDQLGEASSIAARAENLAIQSISRAVDLPHAPGVTRSSVFNPHAWPVRTMVELEFGGLKPTDGLVGEADLAIRSSRSNRTRRSCPGEAAWLRGRPAGRSATARIASCPTSGGRTPGRFGPRARRSKTTTSASSSTRRRGDRRPGAARGWR